MATNFAVAPPSNVLASLGIVLREFNRLEADRLQLQYEHKELQDKVEKLEKQLKESERVKLDLTKRVQMLESGIRQKNEKIAKESSASSILSPTPVMRSNETNNKLSQAERINNLKNKFHTLPTNILRQMQSTTGRSLSPGRQYLRDYLVSQGYLREAQALDDKSGASSSTSSSSSLSSFSLDSGDCAVGPSLTSSSATTGSSTVGGGGVRAERGDLSNLSKRNINIFSRHAPKLSSSSSSSSSSTSSASTQLSPSLSDSLSPSANALDLCSSPLSPSSSPSHSSSLSSSCSSSMPPSPLPHTSSSSPSSVVDNNNSKNNDMNFSSSLSTIEESPQDKKALSTDATVAAVLGSLTSKVCANFPSSSSSSSTSSSSYSSSSSSSSSLSTNTSSFSFSIFADQKFKASPWKPYLILRHHLDGVRQLCFHPDDPHLWSASEDGTVKMWNLSSAIRNTKKKPLKPLEPTCTLIGHSGMVTCVSIARVSGNESMSGGDDSNSNSNNNSSNNNNNSSNSENTDAVVSLENISIDANVLDLASGTDTLSSSSSSSSSSSLSTTCFSSSKCESLAEGDYVLSGGVDGHIMCWEIAQAVTSDLYTPLACSTAAYYRRGVFVCADAVWALATHPDASQRMFFSASADGVVSGWKMRTRNQLQFSIVHPSDSSAVPTTLLSLGPSSFSSNSLPSSSSTSVPSSAWSNLLITGYSNGQLGLIDLNKYNSKPSILTPSVSASNVAPHVLCLAAHPSYPLIFSAHQDERIRFWDLRQAKEVAALKAHNDAVSSVAVDPIGSFIATSGHDQSIRFWELSTRKIIQDLDPHQTHARKYDESVHTIAYHSKYSIFASGGADSLIKVFVP
eukprot:TRINITY_DN959_c0_g1_i3.p1 TRINITY_DN959_c0_g1~~TRINITY_DN959_c0_g1_i3.p1  ORF type:complete len:852 (+),score=359.47 TRINITY_DN959_c0_g1_i3:153-2708(+)